MNLGIEEVSPRVLSQTPCLESHRLFWQELRRSLIRLMENGTFQEGSSTAFWAIKLTRPREGDLHKHMTSTELWEVLHQEDQQLCESVERLGLLAEPSLSPDYENGDSDVWMVLSRPESEMNEAAFEAALSEEETLLPLGVA